MRFAVVDPNGGIVSNVVVGQGIDSVSAVVGPCVEVTEATGPAGEGFRWDGDKFTRPEEAAGA